jgi:hypothetical protein
MLSARQSATKYLVSLSLPLPGKGFRSSQKFNIFYSKFFIFLVLAIGEYLKSISPVLFSFQLNTYLYLSTNDQNRHPGGVEPESNCSRTPRKKGVFNDELSWTAS